MAERSPVLDAFADIVQKIPDDAINLFAAGSQKNAVAMEIEQDKFFLFGSYPIEDAARPPGIDNRVRHGLDDHGRHPDLFKTAFHGLRT